MNKIKFISCSIFHNIVSIRWIVHTDTTNSWPTPSGFRFSWDIVYPYKGDNLKSKCLLINDRDDKKIIYDKGTWETAGIGLFMANQRQIETTKKRRYIFCLGHLLSMVTSSYWWFIKHVCKCVTLIPNWWHVPCH